MKKTRSRAQSLIHFSFSTTLYPLIFIALLTLVSVFANAQVTLFEESFDSGAGSFTTQGNVFTTNGNARMRGGSNDGLMTSGMIDASNHTGLSISFDRSTTGLDSGERGEFLIAINGGEFTLIESLQSASGRNTIALGASADNATLQLMFRINASSFNEIYSIDNIVLEGDTASPPPGDNNSVTGFYLEGGGTATTPDQMSFTNTGDVNLSTLMIDLSSGNGTPVFDPSDVAFTVTSTNNVGFDSNFTLNNGNTVLTLNFSGFNPGETFSFDTDLDDAGGSFTTGAEVAASLLTAEADGAVNATGVFSADGGNANRANVSANDGGDPPPPPPPGGGIGPDPSVASLEADFGPFSHDTLSVSSSVSGFGGGTIHYPTGTNEGPFGVIAVVPGFLSPESSIRWWGPRLSTHGFVVITISTNSGFDNPDSRAVQLVNALNHVISLGNTASSPLNGLVDSSKQGVMGWSMGGGGALKAAADNAFIDAALPQAPFYSGSNNFNQISVGTLILACENDSTAPVNSHASPFYNAIPNSTDKAFLEINNGGHSCANTGNSNQDLLGKYGVSWMKRFLDEDSRYSPFLCGPLHDPDLTGPTISEYRETCPY